jgi:hypothetical protein
MSARLHAIVLNTIPVVAVILWFPWFCQLLFRNTWELHNMCLLPTVLFLFVWLLAFYGFRLRCQERGCNGNLDRIWGERIDYFRIKLHYVCRRCSHTYDTTILRPDGKAAMDIGE